MGGHSPLLISLTVFTAVAFIINAALNALASNPQASGGLYTQSTGNISDKYYIEITPAGWTFSIWGFIYTWQALWIVYAIVTLFRKTDQGPAYNNPVVLTWPFLTIYPITVLLTSGWLVAFDREQLEVSMAILIVVSIALITCLILTYRSLDQCLETLTKQGRRVDIWLTRGLVHNGLGIYATWCTIATHLNFNFLLQYRSSHDIGFENTSTITLSILSVFVVVFAITDLIFLDRYTRYTITPFIVLVVAFSGSVAKNYVAGRRNSIFTVVLLSIAIAMLLVKVVLSVFRHFKRSRDGAGISSDDVGVKV